MRATVTTRGGLFTDPNGIVDRAETDMLATLGKHTVELVQRRLDTVLVNPSGHYRSRIEYNPTSPDQGEVTDSRVVYGPWLEGVESRNRTTRFKGYATFRRAEQEADRNSTQTLRADTEQLARKLS